ncbi:hypothetical protein QBC38DRAFT_448757 [Podospora fimiseda]|uniref:Uncharacterized protein n=1 Tax=Podospora fimiseda TaxID=252190 RepID=A0AAN6YNA1_9PEZI|nr:hypothetical protein QBC38DRAFT_448757 [Podospora fimiseda]
MATHPDLTLTFSTVGQDFFRVHKSHKAGWIDAASPPSWIHESIGQKEKKEKIHLLSLSHATRISRAPGDWGSFYRSQKSEPAPVSQAASVTDREFLVSEGGGIAQLTNSDSLLAKVINTPVANITGEATTTNESVTSVDAVDVKAKAFKLDAESLVKLKEFMNEAVKIVPLALLQAMFGYGDDEEEEEEEGPKLTEFVEFVEQDVDLGDSEDVARELSIMRTRDDNPADYGAPSKRGIVQLPPCQ